MDYQIALSPKLGLSPGDFARAWNETPEASEAARAHEVLANPRGFDPSMAMVVLESLGWAVAGNALYDLIKMALVRGGVRRRTEIRAEERPDGTQLLVVTIEEEE